jgi:hypothetical protein
MTTAQLNLFAAPVSLDDSFETILGCGSVEFDEALRRQRWARWLRLAWNRKRSRDAARYWRDASACIGCRHLRGSWCGLMGLPCTVNPYVSFRAGVIGMACMGTGKDPRDTADQWPDADPMPPLEQSA